MAAMQTPPPLTTPLKIMWWNMHFTSFARDNTYAIAAIARGGMPDIICLQEYVTGADDRLKRWLEEQGYQLYFLDFSSRGTLKQGVMTAVRRGLAHHAKTHVLREDAPMRFRAFQNRRGLVEVAVVLGGRKVSIMNVHLTYPRPHTRPMRLREFDVLRGLLDSKFKDTAWLLGGDFNFFARDGRRTYLTTTYQAFSGGLFRKTWRPIGRYNPVGSNLDYVFWHGLEASPRFALEPFNRSDHRPMVAWLDLPLT